jgi:hypothetical protein
MVVVRAGIHRHARVVAATCALLMLFFPARGESGNRPTSYPVSDSYGYVAYDDRFVECELQFVDIESTGTEVVVVPSGVEPALDEGAALVALEEPFQLYGVETVGLIASTNGYLAATGDLGLECGGDFSNDCAMPAIPDNGAGYPGRIAVLHDDLSGVDTDGRLLAQYFDACPRPSDVLGPEACTVIEWASWGRHEWPGTFDLEVLLYHRSLEIVLQYGPQVIGSSATVALQDATASRALSLSCNPADLDPAGQALCVFDPRFPAGGPQADLEIEIDQAPVQAIPGGVVTYVVSVGNRGPSPVEDASVISAASPLLECEWTCESGPLSRCTVGPIAGPLADADIDLEPSGTVTYDISCSLHWSATGVLETGFSVVAPAGVGDPDPTSNFVSSIAAVVDIGAVFLDGFENGDLSGWTIARP